MKSKIIAQTLWATITFVGILNTAYAETCYNVEGSVNTTNLSPTTQQGTMHLRLTGSDNGDVNFDRTGDVFGNIAYSDMEAIYLNHDVKFNKNLGFHTKFDKVRYVDIIPTSECSFDAIEKITDINYGSGLFKNVTRVDMTADGSISNCPNNNNNTFILYGILCFK